MKWITRTQYWLDTFRVIEVLSPQHIVPGNANRVYLDVERE